MSTSFQLILPKSFYEAMVAQARAELPNECCGLLAGQIEEDRFIVSRILPLVNAAANPRLFESEPRSMFRANREIDKEGLQLLAVYHSHPTSEPVPSKTDLERSYSAEVMCLIISLVNEPAKVRAWWLKGDHFEEASYQISE